MLGFNPHREVLLLMRRPERKVRWTVGQWLMARAHVKGCAGCQRACDRVARKNPGKCQDTSGLN